MSSTVRLTSPPPSPPPSPAPGNDSGGPLISVDVHPDDGGRIGQIMVGDVPLLIDVPESDGDIESVKWGSYPMAPWAGRVRTGRFCYFDADHQLLLNQDDSGSGKPGHQHAMHGTVFAATWTIDSQQPATLEMSCPLDQQGSGWPFDGAAHQRIEVSGHQLRCDLSVTAGHHPSFPAVIGWHPWWRKPASLSFHPDAMYERDDVGLPTGKLVAPSPGPWDDCLVNTAPVTLHYDRENVSDVTVSSDCDHWVVYDEPEHATCVEPQSGPPDAFNLRPEIATSNRALRRTMIVSW